MRSAIMIMMGALSLANAAPAHAQNANTDTAPPVTSPKQIGKDASAVLPSAGASSPSAAPTMVRDCTERPQECTTPPGPGDRVNDGAAKQSQKP